MKFSSTVLSTEALAEAPRIATVKARVRPIISAEAVAVVRRGLRREFWPASRPIGPNSRASAAPVARRNGRPITGLAAVTPSSTASTPAPTHQPVCGTAPTNSPTSASGTPAAISAMPEQQPAAYGRLRQGDVVAERLHRRDPAGAAGRQPGRDHRHDDAGGVRRDGGARREDQRLLGEVEADGRDQRPQPHREHDAEPEPEGRADRADRERLELDRPDHLPLGRAEGAEQGELAAALGDQDREGVDDDVAAHHQRDGREDQQERGEEVDALEQRPGRAPRRRRRR